MRNVIKDKLQALKEMGIEISLDDFGTGYSSFASLQDYAIDELKIDQSFIREWRQNPQKEAVISAMISMAHTLGLRVVCEGVEEEIQIDFLHSLGCDRIQGYVFSLPVSPEVLGERFLSASDLRLQLFKPFNTKNHLITGR